MAGGGGIIGRIGLGAAGFALGGLTGFPAIGSTIGLALGSMLFPPKTEHRVRQVRGALGTSAAEGTPVAIVFGRVRIGGTIMWQGNLRFIQIIKKRGKGGASQSGVVDQYYLVDFAVAIGEGPMFLHRIWEGKDPVSPSYTFYSGSADQSADSFLSGQTGKAIGYRNTAYIVFRDYNLGMMTAIPQMNFEVSTKQQSYDVQLTVEDAETGIDYVAYKQNYITVTEGDPCLTTAYVIKEILTNDRWGGGFTREVRYLDAHRDCVDRGYFLNFAITERRDIASLIEMVSAHGWVFMISSGSVIKLKVATNETPSKTIDISEMLARDEEQRVTVSESPRSERYNRVTSEFTDRNKKYSVRPVQVEDFADQQDRGIYKASASLLAFSKKEVTTEVATHMLRSSLYGVKLLSFSLAQNHINTEVADVLYINGPTVGLSWTRTRVVGIEETEEFNLTMSVKEEPSYIYDDINYVVPGALGWEDTSPTVGLSNVIGFRLFEVPKELLTSVGRIELAILYAKAAENSETTGIDVYRSIDGGTSYDILLRSRSPQSVGVIFDNEWAEDTWLDGSSFEVDTSLTVDSSFETKTRDQTLGGLNLFLVDDQITYIQTATLGATNMYTMSNSIRGRSNTRPETHLVGATVYNLVDTDALDFSKSSIGNTYQYKGVPVNLFGSQAEISDAPALSYKIEGWAYRPYTPTSLQLKENGVNRRGITRTNDRDITVCWKPVDKFTGYGRGGWGTRDYGSYEQDEDLTAFEVDVVVGLTVMRTAIIGTTSTCYIYTEADNISDNISFEENVTFRSYSKSIYGRSMYSDSITITSV